MISVEPLEIPGTWSFTPSIHTDNRGSFLELFRATDTEAIGHPFDVAQVNCSTSNRGVIRGIHFADLPPGQAKYVTCVSGAIWDVAVDPRTGSPNFGGWSSVELSEDTRRAVYLAEGLGHAFLALSAHATVVYLCSVPYAPASEHAVHPLDPALGIAWPIDAEPILSDKDAVHGHEKVPVCGRF